MSHFENPAPEAEPDEDGDDDTAEWPAPDDEDEAPPVVPEPTGDEDLGPDGLPLDAEQ